MNLNLLVYYATDSFKVSVTVNVWRYASLLKKNRWTTVARVGDSLLKLGHSWAVLTSWYTMCIFLFSRLLRAERKSKQNREQVTEDFGASASELSLHKALRKYSKYISGYEARHRHSVFVREINFMN